MLLRVSGLVEGEHVLDCTLGLAADAQVAARLVGPSGSGHRAWRRAPRLYLLVRHGLETLARASAACALQVLHADAAGYLRAAPARLVRRGAARSDVRARAQVVGRLPGAAASRGLRAPHPRDAGRGPRVARRAVVLKGSRYSSDFKKLGMTARARPTQRHRAVGQAARQPLRSAPFPEAPRQRLGYLARSIRRHFFCPSVRAHPGPRATRSSGIHFDAGWGAALRARQRAAAVLEPGPGGHLGRRTRLDLRVAAGLRRAGVQAAAQGPELVLGSNYQRPRRRHRGRVPLLRPPVRHAAEGARLPLAAAEQQAHAHHLAAAELRGEPLKRYPVLYMHDGQNDFEDSTSFTGVSWRADRTSHCARRAGAHGRDHHRGRLQRGPGPDLRVHPGQRLGAVGGADLYGRFLVETVKPWVDRTTAPCRAARTPR